MCHRQGNNIRVSANLVSIQRRSLDLAPASQVGLRLEVERDRGILVILSGDAEHPFGAAQMRGSSGS